jgi:tetratricopeptide (TPR) repeat protein
MKMDLRKLLSNTRMLTRLVIIVGALLVVVAVAFGGYYYYDRYYSTEPSKMETVIREAEQALSQDPKNQDKRLDVSEAYLVNNRIDESLEYTRQVMLNDPENQRAWLLLGLGYAFKGDPATAVEPLQKYYDANKDSEMPGLNRTLQTAAYYLGDSYLKLGQPEKAAEPLENAVGWSKTDADAMYKLGLVYIELEKYEDAQAMFSYATAFVPDYQEAYEGMARIYAITDEKDLLNYAQGMVAYSKKDYQTAIDLLLKSAQAKSDFAPTFAGLGLAYEAQGDLEKSVGAYKTALQLDSLNLTAQQGQQRVQNLINNQ